MNASDIRAKYLKFFASRGHAVIPAAPIIPPDDPTTLFTGSGMQQMMPYLKGEKHPMGTRLVDSQPCFRSEDIEEVGDNRHTTMFEMLGNWSLGDYFKQDQLAWIWEFFTKELGLDEEKLHVTLFEGDDSVDKDVESYEIWRKLGVSEDHIHYYDSSKNWWSRAGTPNKMPIGEIGGPDSEIFYDFGKGSNFHEASEWASKECHVNCDCGRYLEIGNSVFMQYEKTSQGMEPLPAKNVDFGGGFERLVAAVAGTPDIFETDLFAPIIKIIEEFSDKKYTNENKAPIRVIADHLRAATFMISEGLEPSNKLQGYILRRLLRRSAVKMHQLRAGLTPNPAFNAICNEAVKTYVEAGYIQDESHVRLLVRKVIDGEMDKFGRALDRGLREIDKITSDQDPALFAFNLFQSYGFPYEVTAELFAQKGMLIKKSKFDQIFENHKALSRKASAGMFKGGLANSGEVTTKYHTATHLLHQALIDVLGEEVTQAGSNISADRLRFDYTYSGIPTDQELASVIKVVNKQIQNNLPVHKSTKDKSAALESGARAFFVEKYPDRVTVYTIGENPTDNWYSKELCGGPHVEKTGEIGELKLLKDKNLGSGKRRIYLVLA